MRRTLAVWIIALLIVLPALADDMPEWTYPLSPEIIDDPLGYIALVNRDSLMDANYEPSDLQKVTAKRVASFELRKDCNDALNRMFDAALKDGYTLYVKSAYRSFQTQSTMYHNRMEKVGRDDGVVAYPGASDHQTGLGVDILNYEWTRQEGMRPEFGEEAEAKWMAEHCHEYGFIIRYMEDKQEITGIIYEPWHLRYVGKAAAAYIMSNHLSLEEFTEEYRQYIAQYEALGGSLKALVALRAAPKPVIVVGVADDGEEDIDIFY